MPYLRLRLYKPEKFLSADKAPLHLCLVCDGYFLDEISVWEGEHNERPHKAHVKFSEAIEATDAKVVYAGRWTDPSNNHTYPGTLRLSLPLDDSIKSFISTHDFGSQFLILTVYLKDELSAITTMGDGADEVEYSWNSSIAVELAAKIEWLSVDLEPRPAAEPTVVEIPKPLAWQGEAIASLASAQQQQLVVARNLQQQLHAIRTILLVMGVGALLYVAVKAI